MFPDEPLYPDDQQEDEDDLSKVSFRDAVVTNADWTIESINLQMAKGTIDLQPSFQRRGAWDETRKSRLIESIIVGMPVPNIALAENKDHRGRFIVIDGKQRLLAIQEFLSGAYKLRGLDLRYDLNGLTFGALGMSDRESFENSTLRATLIKNWKDENFLWAAFYRLNVGSLPLSPQELRKALIGGKLIEAIEEYLQNSVDFQAIFGAGLDKRMRDSELVLRFLAFDLDISRYRGDFKAFLDDTTRYYEEDWDARSADVMDRFNRLDLALRTARSIFGDNVFRKWLGSRYERVMNRAIFDCIVRFFAEDDIAHLAAANDGAVVESFHEACDDEKFRASIERSTKTLDATYTRLNIWGGRLASIIGKNLDLATLRIC
ncbi:DUF262 domain-containing protein [Burkholderia cenocepacia]|nr:DUF262 domain-containing protein [Burkholderia vietnamiensis]KVX52755.1 hypothetical protein WL06_18755 [Burkholderia cepacia]MBR8213954.1 DUF262 domain-containing protein [Burkholderia vietnamiensis]RQU10407.1 DUF262 domain-containing protein [Burkholderia cenocepacia]RQU18184.1 DUF262 domain-containing protein [Burkholderia cenocepacia]